MQLFFIEGRLTNTVFLFLLSSRWFSLMWYNDVICSANFLDSVVGNERICFNNHFLKTFKRQLFLYNYIGQQLCRRRVNLKWWTSSLKMCKPYLQLGALFHLRAKNHKLGGLSFIYENKNIYSRLEFDQISWSILNSINLLSCKLLLTTNSSCPRDDCQHPPQILGPSAEKDN